MSLTTFLERIRLNWPLLAGVLGVSLLSWVPVLVYGYNYPPCIEINGVGCDVKALQNLLTWDVHGYYGHFPGAILGMHLYYRLVPALVFVGLWVLLRQHGIATIFLVWIALFFISRTIAFDLRNGTFVGIINFYLWGLILARTLSNWLEGKPWSIPTALACIMVFFHAFTGIVMFIGIALYGVIFRRIPIIVVATLLGVSVIVSGTLLSSSVARLQWLPVAGASAPAPVQVQEEAPPVRVGGFVEYPQMSLIRFAKEYVGEGTWIFWFLGVIIGVNAWMEGWRPRHDMALGMLAVMCVPLAVMTFSPLALNADRTAKLLVSLTTILAGVAIMQGMKHFHSRWGYGAGTAGVGLCLAWEVPQLVPYWMQMGSFE